MAGLAPDTGRALQPAALPQEEMKQSEEGAPQERQREAAEPGRCRWLLGVERPASRRSSVGVWRRGWCRRCVVPVVAASATIPPVGRGRWRSCAVPPVGICHRCRCAVRSGAHIGIGVAIIGLGKGSGAIGVGRVRSHVLRVIVASAIVSLSSLLLPVATISCGRHTRFRHVHLVEWNRRRRCKEVRVGPMDAIHQHRSRILALLRRWQLNKVSHGLVQAALRRKQFGEGSKFVSDQHVALLCLRRLLEDNALLHQLEQWGHLVASGQSGYRLLVAHAPELDRFSRVCCAHITQCRSRPISHLRLEPGSQLVAQCRELFSRGVRVDQAECFLPGH
eukprot:scaffold154105_cov36-Tisochrysis_lutea.AAC.2